MIFFFIQKKKKKSIIKKIIPHINSRQNSEFCLFSIRKKNINLFMQKKIMLLKSVSCKNRLHFKKWSRISLIFGEIIAYLWEKNYAFKKICCGINSYFDN